MREGKEDEPREVRTDSDGVADRPQGIGVGRRRGQVRFDEESAVFSTSAGTLTVEGKGLHVRVLDLDSGHVSVDGVVDSLLYEDPTAAENEKRGLFAKLFH